MVGAGRDLQRLSNPTPLIKQVVLVAHDYRSLCSLSTEEVKSFESAFLDLEPSGYRQTSNTSRYKENLSHRIRYFNTLMRKISY